MSTPLPHHFLLLYVWENLPVSSYYQMRIRQRTKKNQSRITMTMNRWKRIAIAGAAKKGGGLYIYIYEIPPFLGYLK
jgi:hypothetical protein